MRRQRPADQNEGRSFDGLGGEQPRDITCRQEQDERHSFQRDRSGEHRASVNLGELRASLSGYLDQYLKANEGVTFADRPLGLRGLHVVAFVQDDATQEVLQAERVEVK